MFTIEDLLSFAETMPTDDEVITYEDLIEDEWNWIERHFSDANPQLAYVSKPLIWR